MRWLRMRQSLADMIDLTPPRLVAYEDVKRHAGTQAAHVYGGLIAVIQEVCEVRQVPYTSLGVGVIKQFATTKGNASKLEMMKSASVKWGRPFLNDNEADAAWIAELAATLYPEASA